MNVQWIHVPEHLQNGVSEIARELGLTADPSGRKIILTPGSDTLGLEAGKNGEVILHYHKDHEIFRAMSYLPAFLKDEKTITEYKKNTMLCYMADMSRNAVYNMPTAKQMIRYLAMMGYDSLMLYTEDTYEVPEYPHFGHMRGRFSKEELKEIDDYAYGFGIEVIPCIQTLAHLSIALRWSGEFPFQDTGDILLVDDERTYDFIRAMFRVCKECFRSDRIDIGMDEAHMLGRGKFMDMHGYEPTPDIMIRHLNRVVDICAEMGYHPMMWSDMFFRMAFNHAYRVSEGEIPPEVVALIPKNLTLIYWDYYSMEPGIFSHMVDCHQKFDNPVAFAGGAWKWSGFAPSNRLSIISTKMQLDICRQKGLSDIIVTAWGDNGSEASQFSVLSSMLYFAEHCYNDATDAKLDARAKMLFSISFDDLLAFDLPNDLPGLEGTDKHYNPCKYLLYNDPLEGIFDRHLDPDTAPEGFKKAAERLMKLSLHPKFGYAYETLGRLCELLADKCDLTIKMREAYQKGDRETLAYIAEETIPVIMVELTRFIDTFRRQWYRENKTFGFATQDVRLGGLLQRLEAAQERLTGYLDGVYEKIEELEQPVLWFDCRSEDSTRSPYISYNSWNRNANISAN